MSNTLYYLHLFSAICVRTLPFVDSSGASTCLLCVRAIGSFSSTKQADKKTKEEKVEERVTLGPKVAEGENVFGVAHIFASFNDTFVVSTSELDAVK